MELFVCQVLEIFLQVNRIAINTTFAVCCVSPSHTRPHHMAYYVPCYVQSQCSRSTLLLPFASPPGPMQNVFHLLMTNTPLPQTAPNTSSTCRPKSSPQNNQPRKVSKKVLACNRFIATGRRGTVLVVLRIDLFEMFATSCTFGNCSTKPLTHR